jgi:anti-anti-sigma factor
MANETRATLRDAAPLLVMDLSGEVTSLAGDAVNGAYRQACDRGATSLLLNFGGVDYMNSSGIAVIIGLLTDARRNNRRLLITGLTPHYRKIFQMMGLSQHAPVFDSEDAALQAFSQP